jgi:hypothetical protein
VFTQKMLITSRSPFRGSKAGAVAAVVLCLQIGMVSGLPSGAAVTARSSGASTPQGFHWDAPQRL